MHGDDIRSFIVRAGSIESLDALQTWASFLAMRFAGQLLRIKGFASVSDAGTMLVQGARGDISLKHWADDGSEATELVVIARHMDEHERRSALRSALASLSVDAQVDP